MRIRKFIALCFACCLFGCATDVSTPLAVKNAISVSSDVYLGTTTYIGPKVEVANVGSWLNQGFAMTWLSSTRSKDADYFYIQVYLHSKQWAFLDSAYDRQQIKFPVTVISRNIESGLSINESVAIKVSRTYLHEKSQTGVDIKVLGSKGALQILIPPHYVQGFLSGLPA